MTLPLKDRPNAQKRAAHAALTEAQTNGDKTIIYELLTELPKWLAERKPPITLSAKVLRFDNMRKGFRNYTHDVGVAIWSTDRDNLDILTEDKKLRGWIANNQVIQDTLAGYRKARGLRTAAINTIKSGETKDMTEKEIQALIKAISNCVPEPPPEASSCGFGRD